MTRASMSEGLYQQVMNDLLMYIRNVNTDAPIPE